MGFSPDILEICYFWWCCSIHIIYWGKSKVIEVVQSQCELSESYQCSASLTAHSSTGFFSLQSSACPCKIFPHGGCCRWRWCWSPPKLFEVMTPLTHPHKPPLTACENDWKQWFSNIHLRKKWTKNSKLVFFFNKDGVKATSWWACKVHTPQHIPPPNPPLFPAPRRKSCFLKMNLFLLKANISPPAYILQGLVMQQAQENNCDWCSHQTEQTFPASSSQLHLLLWTRVFRVHLDLSNSQNNLLCE